MKGFLKRVKQYRQTYYSRQSLKELDARALKDLGLTKGEALREARRPFWDSKAFEAEHDFKSTGVFPYNLICLLLVSGMGLTVCCNIL